MIVFDNGAYSRKNPALPDKEGVGFVTRPHFDIAQQSMVLWDDLTDLSDKLAIRILRTIDGAMESKDKSEQ